MQGNHGPRRKHIAKPENIIRIPEPPPAGCVCHSYEADPPADRRLPGLHRALHAAQNAYDALFDETRHALRNRDLPPGDYYHAAQRAADELDDAIRTIYQAIDAVSEGRI